MFGPNTIERPKPIIVAIAFSKTKLSGLLEILDGEPASKFSINGAGRISETKSSGEIEVLDGVNVYNVVNNLEEGNLISHSDFEFIGLAFGEKKISIIEEPNDDIMEIHTSHGHEGLPKLSIGLTPPFDPTIFAIFKKRYKVDGNTHYRYMAEELFLKREENLYIDGGNGALKKPISNETLSHSRFEFSDNPTFNDFSFAYFPKEEIYNILTFSETLVFLSGAVIKFGLGYHHYSGNEYFSLKMEADELIFLTINFNAHDNVYSISLKQQPSVSFILAPKGEPEFIIGTPCPPHWDQHK